ncbi:tRNA pseudouridine(38-40) synthase TruA [Oceanomicrobium pacificus]|uniref:tRNA pseudouridine synthase A n=1 Tax=Oceanomicrobium pacificus TaxID=2692916 RepID=A0A6B0TSG5_9RHOB|nr:tRNA pseudouridine(38-40) synthase TruA [Oceanomicrobium pacificus]MXU64274.1 tRNA pseudouridine(38-40) synthase TruA [Oceanomicrobium pacificus]
MARYALKLEYDGTGYAGWQKQADHPSVQTALETALSKLEPGHAGVTAAGRTDAGVHATGQVAHVDLARPWTPFRLMEALNAHLKNTGVAVLDLAIVPDDFSARFSAVERQYLYRIINRRSPAPLEAGRVWRIGHRLDTEAMQAGANHLIGRHDFTTFRSTLCQAASPVKTLDALDVEAVPLAQGQEIRIHVRARSFLHNQVRSFVGTLARVGSGSWPPEKVAEILAARDRRACGPVSPPQGLYLAEVRYPDPVFSGFPSGDPPDPAAG